MQRIHQTTALTFLAFSVFIVWESWKLEYYTKLGPGPGFFPFWLGAAMGAFSLVWLLQVCVQSGRPKEGEFLPERAGIGRILSILAALIAMGLFMDLLGFQLLMFLFLFFLLRTLGRQALWITLLIAIFGSIGMFHIFGGYLDVPLPAASVKILARLGL